MSAQGNFKLTTNSMKVPYFPGCTLKTTARNFEKSAMASAHTLGIDLVELPRWNCCGTVFSLSADDLIHHVASVRNLIRVQEMNKQGLVTDDHRLVTLCSMCFNTLKRSNLRVKENAEDMKKINDLMYREEDYQGHVEVVHFIELIRDLGFGKVKRAVKKSLAELKVAPYYGCMILRPKEVSIDDPEAPTIMDEMLQALGTEVISTPYNKVCCGSYQTVQDKYIVAELTHDILTHAQKAGAEAMATTCPLCAFNLDNRQKEVVEKYPNFKKMPIFYMTQLMALAFDLDEKSYGFEQNFVDPKPLLKAKNLLKQ